MLIMRLQLLCLLLLSTTVAQAQVIEVLDATSRTALPAAHVRLEGLEQRHTQTLLTNLHGKGVVPAAFLQQHQRFSVTISYVGYSPTTDTLSGAFTTHTFLLQESPVTLNQLVITAQYAPSSSEKAVHKVKIIDRKQIEAQGAVTLEDVLQQETNLRISQDQVLGSSVSLQGISGQNVKVLVDGVPVIGRLNGNVDLSQINLNNIERIEIVEGPLSVNYGTNALAGTINLITKKEQQKKLEVGLNSYYETAGQYNLDGRVGVMAGRHIASISGGRNYFDGWSPADPLLQFPQKRPADTLRYKSWKPKEQHFARGQYSYRLGKMTLRAFGGWFREEITNRGYPRGPYHETAFDDYYRTWRTDGGVAASGEIAPGKRLNVVVARNNFQRIKNTYFTDLTTLEQELTANASDQDTSRFGLWMSRGSFSTSRDTASLNYELGYDISYESAYGVRIKGREQHLGDYALFASAEWQPWESLTLRPGLRAAYNTSYQAPLIPSLNLRYRWKPLTLRGSYANGFRAPTLKELYFDFVDVNHDIHGNTKLDAEYSDNYHLSLRWQHLKEQRLLSLELGGYYNDIRNLITLGLTGSGADYSYINIGRYKTLGLQGEASCSIQHLQLSLGGAYVGRYNSVADEYAVNAFSYSPEVRSSALYEIQELKLQLAAFYKYNGALPGYGVTPEGEVYETAVAAYHLLDVSITKAFWKNHIKWTLGGKNLLNVQNIQATAATGGAHSASAGAMPVAWGRSFFTKVSFQW